MCIRHETCDETTISDFLVMLLINKSFEEQMNYFDDILADFHVSHHYLVLDTWYMIQWDSWDTHSPHINHFFIWFFSVVAMLYPFLVLTLNASAAALLLFHYYRPARMCRCDRHQTKLLYSANVATRLFWYVRKCAEHLHTNTFGVNRNLCLFLECQRQFSVYARV